MKSDTGSSHKFYGEEDVAALIRTLDRGEDHHIFAEDVLKTYPYLAESYTKVCPRRCDLATAAQKALDGAYSYDAKLTELKTDVALMVSNCVAYNGPTSAYAEAAAKFERFALDQIDLFLVEQNGGRRLSRLRLPAAADAAASPSPPPLPPVSSDPRRKTPAASEKKAVEKTTAAATATPTFAVPTTREVVQLVDGLNRREDGGAFAVDVAEAYPDLRESYQKVCPQPMDLRRMHQRAKEGVYTAAADPPLFGPTVAASFTRLRDDVELLVRNCLTFNAKVDSWVALAADFHAFAHRRIDDFVLRHAASLRGTQTGAQAYDSTTTPTATAVKPTATAAAAPVDAAPSSSSPADGGGRLDGRKRERTGGSESSASAAAAVCVVGEVAPHVRATPLQPNLVLPQRLRRRLALEHLQHTALPLRRVGVSVPHHTLYPPATATDGPAASASSEQPVTIDAACSAGHVLSQLQASVEHFFSDQRCRPDFVDAFAFSQREEQLYLSVLQVVAAQFESTAPHLLLYERESAELAEWTALHALQLRGRDPLTPRLADQLHYLYLVRFLVQWPQLACLCCASTTPAARNGSTPGGGTGARNASPAAAAAGTAAQGSLRISRDQLKAMAQVAIITQEFLDFIERWEERVAAC